MLPLEEFVAHLFDELGRRLGEVGLSGKIEAFEPLAIEAVELVSVCEEPGGAFGVAGDLLC